MDPLQSAVKCAVVFVEMSYRLLGTFGTKTRPAAAQDARDCALNVPACTIVVPTSHHQYGLSSRRRDFIRQLPLRRGLIGFSIAKADSGYSKDSHVREVRSRIDTSAPSIRVRASIPSSQQGRARSGQLPRVLKRMRISLMATFLARCLGGRLSMSWGRMIKLVQQLNKQQADITKRLQVMIMKKINIDVNVTFVYNKIFSPFFFTSPTGIIVERSSK